MNDSQQMQRSNNILATGKAMSLQGVAGCVCIAALNMTPLPCHDFKVKVSPDQHAKGKHTPVSV